MPNNYTVYKHTTPSGKVYIGITSTSITKRWKHGKGYEGCSAFYRAITKYGWDNIKHEVVFAGLSKEEACRKEQELIAQYDSANPSHGYNLTLGGEHYEPNDEWIEKVSESHKAYYKAHPEACKRISEIQTGRTASAETKIKMSLARKRYIQQHPEVKDRCRLTFKGMKRSEENRNKLRLANMDKVICLETSTVFDSIQDAAKWAKVCRSSVSNTLTGRSKTAGGYHFGYYKGGADNGE